jgi:hypothetical protein
MELAAREQAALSRLRPAGRSGATLFAMAAIERLRPLLERIPSGAPPVIAGVALKQLWRVLEGAERPEPRTLRELSEKCWALVEIEPVEGVETVYLELLVAGAHHALETYLAGKPDEAITAARKTHDAAAHKSPQLAEQEWTRQDRDLGEIEAAVRAGAGLPAFATKLRERAESEGEKLVAMLLKR